MSQRVKCWIDIPKLATYYLFVASIFAMSIHHMSCPLPFEICCMKNDVGYSSTSPMLIITYSVSVSTAVSKPCVKNKQHHKKATCTINVGLKFAHTKFGSSYSYSMLHIMLVVCSNCYMNYWYRNGYIPALELRRVK